jgi:alkylation response protein AidB-like acyl-CoA dehydrogenase
MHDHANDTVAAGEAANMAKYAAAEAGLHALDAAIQTHGGNGMTSEYRFRGSEGHTDYRRQRST